MKRSFFSLLLTCMIVGVFTVSCSKDNLYQNEPVRVTADSGAEPSSQQNFGIPALQKKLVSISSPNYSLNQFQYDLSGRLSKVAGLAETTEFLYWRGGVTVKQYKTGNPSQIIQNFTATLDTAGRATKVEGLVFFKSRSGTPSVSMNAVLTFKYDATGRLLEWKGTAKDAANVTHYPRMLFTWNNGNLSSTSYFYDSKLKYTDIFTYELSQPDKRGVWDNVMETYSGNLFGTRNKNLSTKETHLGPNYEFIISFSKFWTLDANEYVLTETPITYIGTNGTPQKYSFQ